MTTLKTLSIALSFTLIISSTTVTACRSQSTVAARNISNRDDVRKMEQDVLSIINQYRQGKGLAPLVADDNFTLEAEHHSEDMAGKKTGFGHDGFEGRVQRLMKKLGPLKMSAENVAYGQMTATEVVNNWLKSPGHRKNIEGNYNTTGIGITPDKNGVLFFTQIFAAR